MATVSVNALTPSEVVKLISDVGFQKGSMRLDKIFMSAFSAGALLAFACGTVLICNASPWMQDNAPGLIRVLAALVFPYGLCMIILTGVDLCTASFMVTTLAVLQRRLAWYRMLMHWTVTFLGNLAGSLFIVGVLFHYGDTFAADPYKAQAISFAVKKQVSPSFGAIFLRGIGCNWLVCLACFFAIQGRSLMDKIVGIWWPIFAFVSLGFDHTVANMAFIPLGIILGAPNLTVGLYIWKGIIPVVLGNIAGGGVFCAMFYWYMYTLDFSKPPALLASGDETVRASAEDLEAQTGRMSTAKKD